MLQLNLRKSCLAIVSLILLSSSVPAQTGTWTRKADLPKGGGSACVYDGKIYVMGGTSLPGYTDLAYNMVYDPSTNTWEEKAPMPTARGFLYTTVFNDTIYAIGGGFPNYKLKVEAYAPKTNTWTAKKHMPKGLMGSSSVFYSLFASYIVGGNYNERECWAYCHWNDTWQQKASLPWDAGGCVSVPAHSYFYAFGGSTYPPWGARKTVYEYDILNDTWIKKQDMPTARFAFKTYEVKGKIYAIGGSQGESSSLSSVEVYDPENDTWEIKPNMPVSLSWFTGAVVNDKIYVIGGTSDWFTSSKQVWEYNPNPECYWAPQVINFTSTQVGESSDTISVKIYNVGYDAFNINSVNIKSNQINLINLPDFPYILKPSDSLHFGVAFYPVCHGEISVDINVETSNPGYPHITIPVKASGIRLGSQMQLFVNRIKTAQYQERSAIIDSFLTAHPVLPLIEEDSVCQFLYLGNANSVNCAGDANRWNIDISKMTRLSSTDLWYYTDVYEPDARLEYKFVLNGTNWIVDPRNPQKSLGGYENSEVAMPAYVYAPEMVFQPDIPHGTIKDTTIFSVKLNNSRKISVYLPASYDPAGLDTFNIVLFHDGLEFIEFAKAQHSLDYLIYHKLIEPVIGIFIPAVNRNEEYFGPQVDSYSEFIVNELLPYIDNKYRTKLNPQNRATIGISLGGNIALWIMHKYPHDFGNAASHSGNIGKNTSEAYNTITPEIRNHKLYIDAGTYDLGGFLDISKNFSQLLEAKGYNYHFNIWHEGHNWSNWGSHLDLVLQYFFPGSAVSVTEESQKIYTYSLMQNYPNPFNPLTIISFELPEDSKVELKIYNMLGQEIKTLLNEEKPRGKHQVQFNASNLSSGMYIYKIKANDFVSVKKMMLVK